MAPVTIEGSPGNSTIVAFAAKLPFNDLDHADLIGTGPHHENIRMADLTLKPDAMKPVGKDHGGHLGLLGLPIHDDIPILGLGSGIR
jgi:hypothetical protein